MHMPRLAIRSLGLLALLETLAAGTCGPVPQPAVELTKIDLSGPQDLTVGAPKQPYTVNFSFKLNNGNQLGIPIVSLVEEANGISTGGVFSWQNIVLAEGQLSGSVTFHLACPGNSVVGLDGPPFYPNCQVARPPGQGCALNEPCSCFRSDNTTFNDPNSQLGGRDAFGNRLGALIHADVVGVPGGPSLGHSSTLQVLCQP